MPKKAVQTFNEYNTKVVQGYVGSATPGDGGKLEVEKVHNTYGSCAGAGSGEFDVYRGAKRREQLRIEYMDKRDEAAAAASLMESKITGNKRYADERTAKNADKRNKKKMKKKELKSKHAVAAAADKSGSEDDNIDPAIIPTDSA